MFGDRRDYWTASESLFAGAFFRVSGVGTRFLEDNDLWIAFHSLLQTRNVT